MKMKKHLVISAVNLIEGGTLTVLRECLQVARAQLGQDWRISAIVHRAELVGVPGVDYIERPEIKRSWLSRLWFEYVECRKLSRQMKADFWLALHDMTPVVGSPRQAVYCHNAMCFYRMSLREGWQEPKLLLFSYLYAHLYRLNIRANTAVIVQQDWIRKEFIRRFGCRTVIVSHPVAADEVNTKATRRVGNRFLYPSLPRVFKNFETLLAAWEELCASPQWDAELLVTLDGSENRYARRLVKRYGGLRNVRFSGRLSSTEMEQAYQHADCLVFPSRLETWGLPLSEAKQEGLTILAADLPYAHEAIGQYDGVAFFPPDDASQLAVLMRRFAQGKLDCAPAVAASIEAPFAGSWAALLTQLLDTKAPELAAAKTDASKQ